MKTKNKIISIAVCICLLLSGCSQDKGEEPNTGNAGGINTPAAENADGINTPAAGNADSISTPAAENSEVTVTPAAENTEIGNTETDSAKTEAGTDNGANTSAHEAAATEAENTPADERFAYLDLLSEEYEKYGRLYSFSDDITCVNGKVVSFNEDMVVYDVKKKEITFKKEDIHDQIAYDDKNGYIYTYDFTTLNKFDSSGSLICQVKFGAGYAAIPTVFPDGTCVMEKTSSHSYDLYSSDFKTVTELPIPQAEVEHGIKKDIQEYEIMAKYNNKIYAVSKGGDTNGYYCLNTDTMTWEAAQSDLKEIPAVASEYGFNLYADNIIGKYWLISYCTMEEGYVTKVYDMETDKVVATISAEDCTYNGRSYELELQDGILKKIQYPGDGSDAISKRVFNAVSKKVDERSAIPFDEQYYVYQDNYGIFLREYGKAEDGEITILMFEQ